MKKILSKDEFVSYINKIREVDTKWAEFYSLLDVWPGGDKLSLITECADLLSFIMGDEVDSKFGTYIGWFCWEIDYGLNDETNKIWIADEHGEKEVSIDSPEVLYDFLVEELNKREENN